MLEMIKYSTILNDKTTRETREFLWASKCNYIIFIWQDKIQCWLKMNSKMKMSGKKVEAEWVECIHAQFDCILACSFAGMHTKFVAKSQHMVRWYAITAKKNMHTHTQNKSIYKTWHNQVLNGFVLCTWMARIAS